MNYDYRIKGRTADVDSVNDNYPKFTVHTEPPYLQQIIKTSGELVGLPENAVIYEPLEAGLGVMANAMYVKDLGRTFLFIYEQDVSDVFTWGDTIVQMGSTSITFGD